MAEPTATSSSPAASPVKIISGADPFGADLKNHLVNHIRNSLNIPVEDLGTGPYYSIAASVGTLISSSSSQSTTGTTTIGLLCCGTGCGVSMFANKFPGAFAATCLSTADAINARSISNANIVAFSALSTTPAAAEEILSAFLSTPYKSPCPANNNLPWPSDILEFLDKSLEETPRIGSAPSDPADSCAVCCLAKNRELTEIELIAGGKMKILRESPTSAVVRFAAGSVEPAHHHTFGHCLIVMEGRKSVWNLTKVERYDLVVGDYLFTPAGDVHRVAYHEDTEFFIKWDGKWDIFFDEDADTAGKAVQAALTTAKD